MTEEELIPNNNEDSGSDSDEVVDLFSLEVSFLSGSGLRNLFQILKDVHPEALSDALAIMLKHCKKDKNDAKSYLKNISETEELFKNDNDTGSISGSETTDQPPLFVEQNQSPDNTFGQNLFGDSSASKSPLVRKKQVEAPEFFKETNQSGCYLLYDVRRGALTLQYSHTYVSNAIGFWEPGHGEKIQEFKFKGKHFGRYDLIQKCKKKDFYGGWCQFVRAARAMRGSLVLFMNPHDAQHSTDFELYVFYKYRTDDVQTVRVAENTPFSVDDISAVACLPQFSEFAEFSQVQVDLPRWLIVAGERGATTSFVPTLATTSDEIKTKSAIGLEDLYQKYAPSQSIVETEKTTEDQPKIAQEGCYLVHETESSKLILHYSRYFVYGAIGFWKPSPGHKIKEFKFKGKHFGKHPLVNNCASRKDYYGGWIQFIKAAKAMEGSLWLYGRGENEIKGYEIEIFVYQKDRPDEVQTIIMPENEEFKSTEIKALACLPKFSSFQEIIELGIKMDVNRWLNEANAIGVASKIN